MLWVTYSVTASTREAARLLALRAAADAVGHHREEREALRRRATGVVREAGAVDLDLPPERADEEVVLVVDATLPGWVSP